MAVYSMPNSLSVALALGIQEYKAHSLATICLSNSSLPVNNCPMPKGAFIESGI